MAFWRTLTKPTTTTVYQKVRFSDNDGQDSKEALLDEAGSSNSSVQGDFVTTRRGRKCERFLYPSLLLNIALSVIIAIFSVPMIHQHIRDPFNNTLIKQVSMPSPILDQMHIPLKMERRNGSLLPNNPPSLYNKEPSEDVDDAWDRLTNINPIPISAKDVENIGYDPSTVARWPEEYGLGEDAYVARLDVFHEIHCLNMLRKEIHWEYYGWDKPSDALPDHKVHISHCIYALLQSLMCSANTDPFIHYWVDIGDEPYPDFSINRQCRDFEAVLEWQEENSIPMSQFRDVIRKPENAAPRIMSLEYKYMVGLISQDPAVNLTAARLEEFEHVHG